MQAARSLAAEIRASAVETERGRRLAPALVAKMAEAGLFHLYRSMALRERLPAPWPTPRRADPRLTRPARFNVASAMSTSRPST
jgi:hypothetical protein